MPGDSSKDTRRELLTAASAIGLGAFVTGNVQAVAQDDSQMVRSRRISEEVVVGSSMAKSPDYNEAKNHSLIQVIEHVFKEDEDPAAGYPVTRVKEFKVRADTKLAIVTVSGFEFWFGTKDQELIMAASRLGVHAALEADFRRASLTAKVRANYRFWRRDDHEWAWRCHVVIQCFGEN
ncbi:MAG: hypothetical protein ACHRXM_02030 [Isosphaerales bacterium]